MSHIFSSRIALKSFPRGIVASSRPFSITSATRAYKGSQDKDSWNPQSSENTTFGKDNDMAEHPEAAFGKSQNKPETEREVASADADKSPLEASGANQELSKPQGDEKQPDKHGAGKNIETQKPSGAGSPGKKGSPGKV